MEDVPDTCNMQSGVTNIDDGSINVEFNHEFSKIPVVVITPVFAYLSNENFSVYNVTTKGFSIRTSALNTEMDVMWIATTI